jgi:hypothetical protein
VVIAGFMAVMATRARGAEEARQTTRGQSLELHNVSTLTDRAADITSALSQGQTVRMFGSYYLSRDFLKCDMDLVLAQLGALQSDISDMSRHLKRSSDEKSRTLRSQNRQLRLAAVDSNKGTNYSLYSLVVEEANLRWKSQTAWEEFKRNNRVVLNYRNVNDRRMITSLTVIRDGQSLRNTLPATTIN